jgi:hypothetical protein
LVLGVGNPTYINPTKPSDPPKQKREMLATNH